MSRSVSNDAREDELVCMMCCKPARDGKLGFESDEEGDLWVYCRTCDCWTSHPPESVGLTREETRRRF